MSKTKRLSDLDQRLLRYGDLKPFLVALRADLKTIRDRLDALEAQRAALHAGEPNPVDSGPAQPISVDTFAPTEGL